MFIVLLRISADREALGLHMVGHKDWLQQGFDDGVFLLAGGLQPAQSGAILTRDIDRADLEARLAKDPFISNDLVTVDIMEVSPSKASDELNFLLKQ